MTDSTATYDYIEETFPSVKYNPGSERIAINGSKEDGGLYHDTVMYHSAGPSIAAQADSLKKVDYDEHIYEDDTFLSSLKQDLGDPIYEDTSLSQVLCPDTILRMCY